jgi:hypothetical protein
MKLKPILSVLLLSIAGEQRENSDFDYRLDVSANSLDKQGLVTVRRESIACLAGR